MSVNKKSSPAAVAAAVNMGVAVLSAAVDKHIEEKKQDPSTVTSIADAAARATGRDADLVRRGNAYFIDPTLVDRREGWNPRFDFGEIEELSKSIAHQLSIDPKSGGLLNDIRVKRKEGGRFELVDGDRRMTAIELLMKAGTKFPDGIPAKIEAKGATDFDLLVRMFTANTGKPFRPIEEAAAFDRMREEATKQGIKPSDVCKWIGKMVGRSDIHVWETLQLLTADDAVMEAINGGTITATVAKKIAIHAKGDKAKQKELVEKAKGVGKDKAKRAALNADIEAARQKKHAKKGRVLKIRALDDAALSALGEKVAGMLVERMKDAGKKADFNMRDWIKKDDNLALAFTLGALDGLKAAAGQKIDLSI